MLEWIVIGLIVFVVIISITRYIGRRRYEYGYSEYSTKNSFINALKKIKDICCGASDE